MVKRGNSGAAKRAKTGGSNKSQKNPPKIGNPGGNPPGSAATSKKSAYEWSAFTRKNVEFTAAAARLDDYVKTTYGEGVSITQYEKFLVHYAGTSDEEKSRLWVDATGIALSQEYRTAKVARDDERNAFRGDIQVADVQGTLASLAATFSGPSGPPKRSREDDGEMDGDEEGGSI